MGLKHETSGSRADRCHSFELPSLFLLAISIFSSLSYMCFGLAPCVSVTLHFHSVSFTSSSLSNHSHPLLIRNHPRCCHFPLSSTLLKLFLITTQQRHGSRPDFSVLLLILPHVFLCFLSFFQVVAAISAFFCCFI